MNIKRRELDYLFMFLYRFSSRLQLEDLLFDALPENIIEAYGLEALGKYSFKRNGMHFIEHNFRKYDSSYDKYKEPYFKCCYIPEVVLEEDDYSFWWLIPILECNAKDRFKSIRLPDDDFIYNFKFGLKKTKDNNFRLVYQSQSGNNEDKNYISIGMVIRNFLRKIENTPNEDSYELLNANDSDGKNHLYINFTYTFEDLTKYEFECFNKIIENQNNFARLINEYENLGFLKFIRKKEIVRELNDNLKYSYFVILKALLDRFSIDNIDSDISDLEKYLELLIDSMNDSMMDYDSVVLSKQEFNSLLKENKEKFKELKNEHEKYSKSLKEVYKYKQQFLEFIEKVNEIYKNLD